MTFVTLRRASVPYRPFKVIVTKVPDRKLRVLVKGQQLPDDILLASPKVAPELIETVRKTFAGAPVLCGLDFQIAPGQSTALIGANGSGTSTLLKCLVRLIEPTAGRITMLGRDVCAL